MRGFLGIEYLHFLDKAMPLSTIEMFSFNFMSKCNFDFNTRPRCF